MKVIVFGATGGIGHHVVEQALAAGHEVTAIARRPAAITIQHRCLHVVQGDVLDAETLIAPMRGQEAVVSSIGAPDRKPTVVYSQGAANIMKAMIANDVRRLQCISATGLEPGPWWQRMFARPILWYFLKESYTDLARMEAVVRASKLDWTIVRPPKLTDDAHTGHYFWAANEHLKHCFSISRADLADYMVSQINNPATFRAVVEVASK